MLTRVYLARARLFQGFSFIILLLLILIFGATFFFFRFGVRWARNRKIEIDKSTGALSFFGAPEMSNDLLKRDEILSVERVELNVPVKISTRYAENPSFTLRIHKRAGGSMDACTSDQKSVVQKFLALTVF